MPNSKLRHLEIRHQLNLSNSSFSAIARSLGLSHTAILSVSNGRIRSQRIAEALASTLKTTPHDLWPEIYSAQKEDVK